MKISVYVFKDVYGYLFASISSKFKTWHKENHNIVKNSYQSVYGKS